MRRTRLTRVDEPLCALLWAENFSWTKARIFGSLIIWAGSDLPQIAFAAAATGQARSPTYGLSCPQTTQSKKSGDAAATACARNVPAETQVPLSRLKSSVTRPSK